jgi:hypothetical protein
MVVDQSWFGAALWVQSAICPKYNVEGVVSSISSPRCCKNN